MQKKISRGSFLKAMGAAGVAGSTLSVLSACTVSTTPQSSGSDGGSGEENRLNLYNWSEYIASSNIKDFEKKTGAQVTQDFYASNEELLAKLQAGGTGYDVIVPSDYMVAVMAKSGVIEELDFSKIPNFDNIGDNFKGCRTTQRTSTAWATSGGPPAYSYNEKETGKVDSWDAMWDPQFEGKIAMMDDVRETMGAALVQLGYPINATDPEQMDKAKQLLDRAEAAAQGLLPRHRERTARGERRHPPGPRLQRDGYPLRRRERGARLHHPQTKGDPLDRHHVHPCRRPAPGRRARVHKLHARSPSRTPRLRTLPTTPRRT